MAPFSWICPNCGKPTTIVDSNIIFKWGHLDFAPANLGKIYEEAVRSIYRSGSIVVEGTERPVESEKSNEELERETTEYIRKIDFGRLPYSIKHEYLSALGYGVEMIVCPNLDCQKPTLKFSLIHIKRERPTTRWHFDFSIKEWPIWPASIAKPQPDFIPPEIIEDYNEACLVAALSPKASATLSRRCLQSMIENFWGIHEDNLHAAITALQDRIDDTMYRAIDAIRETGNIGAHMQGPIGRIVEVDPGEARTLIELIELLFDDWYRVRHEREQIIARAARLGETKGHERKKARQAKTTAKRIDR